MKKKSSFIPLTVRRDEVDRFASLIAVGWRQATESIMAVAKSCSEAEANLLPEEKKELFAILPFGQSVFSKLVAIGNDKRLSRPRVQKLLPPSYSTLYEVSHLPDDKLKEAIAEEALTPKAKRSDIIAYLKSTHKNRKMDVAKPPATLFFAEIRLPKDFDTGIALKLLTALRNFESDYGAEVLLLSDGGDYQRLVTRLERQQSKDFDRVTLKMKAILKAQIRKKIKKAGGLRGSCFIQDEINLEVPVHELDSTIKQVLETLGRDDYRELRKTAENQIDSSAIEKLTKRLENEYPFALLLAEPNLVDVKDQLSPSDAKMVRKKKFAKLKV